MTTYTLFDHGAPGGSQITDTDGYTLAVEFYVTTSGCTLTQIHFYSAVDQPGSNHASRLYQVTGSDTGTLVSGSSKSLPTLVTGWNTVTLDAPITLTANQRYRAGVYFAVPNGYTATGAYWSSGAGSAGLTSGPLAAPNSTDANAGHQGSFAGSTDGYPSGFFNAGNYWIDVTVDDNGGTADSGALAGATPPAAGALTGTVIDVGALAGTTVALVGALASGAAGALAGAAPALTGALAGTVIDYGYLPSAGNSTPGEGTPGDIVPGNPGSITLPVGALTGTVAASVGPLAANTPALTGALTATLTAAGALAGSTPRPVGAVTTLPPTVYPLHAGTATDNITRRAGGTATDNVARYAAGTVPQPNWPDFYLPTYPNDY